MPEEPWLIITVARTEPLERCYERVLDCYVAGMRVVLAQPQAGAQWQVGMTKTHLCKLEAALRIITERQSTETERLQRLSQRLAQRVVDHASAIRRPVPQPSTKNPQP